MPDDFEQRLGNALRAEASGLPFVVTVRTVEERLSRAAGLPRLAVLGSAGGGLLLIAAIALGLGRGPLGVGVQSQSPSPRAQQPIGLFQTNSPVGDMCLAIQLDPQSYRAGDGAVMVQAWRPSGTDCRSAKSVIVPERVKLGVATLPGGGSGWAVQGWINWPNGVDGPTRIEAIDLTLDIPGSVVGTLGQSMTAFTGTPRLTVRLDRIDQLQVTGATDPWSILEAGQVELWHPMTAGFCDPGSPVERSKAIGPVIGPPPVYVSGADATGTTHWSQLGRSGGAHVLKVVWLSDASYQGPVLVRPMLAEGAEPLRPATNDGSPLTEVRLPQVPSEWPPGLEPGFRIWVSNLLVPETTGCAGLQVDGLGFTTLIEVRIAR